MKPLLLSVALVLLVPATAWSGPLRIFKPRPTSIDRATHPHPYPAYRSYYPRYHGGFHERYFQEIGIPPGDRPLRGTAW